jgi:hypothetical protein
MKRELALAVWVFCMACNSGKDETDGSPQTTAEGPWADLDLDQITSSAMPTKRSEILAAGNEATNSILVFGGNDGPVVNQILSSVFLGDTWVFQPGTGWTEIAADPSPRRRGRYTVSTDEEGHRALLFGGRFRIADTTGDYTLFDDLWEFDFDTRTWTELHNGSGGGGAGPGPAARYYPVSAFDAGTGLYYIWGGALNADPLVINTTDDLWSWDGEAWTELQTTGDKPSPRTFLGSLHDTKRNQIVIFGGQSGDFVSCSYNDLYALDLDTLAWTELHAGSSGPGGAKVPETRFHPHLQYDATNDRYLMFGGHADIGAMNDLWAYDPNEGKWSKVKEADLLETDPNSACDNIVSPGCLGNPTEVPKEFALEDPTAPERRYRGMFTLMHDNLWLGLGINIECSDHLDDTWRYDMASDTWIELIEAKSGESCIRRGDDCECMCI